MLRTTHIQKHCSPSRVSWYPWEKASKNDIFSSKKISNTKQLLSYLSDLEEAAAHPADRQSDEEEGP